ncbi:hypothetical protein D9613_008568 [Agrocybe pediades]|uniref:protein-histidine N-methyltransferase n=1 Tax=Agrocybe pediades TaxID=84607 RepID=A0A8H4QU15_9AGAR|nr:hypothetical protein D9613_008568 [Agrocybe pediades]
MFKFDFDIEEDEDAQDLLNLGIESIKLDDSPSKTTGTEQSTLELEPFSEIPLKQLLDTLPALISYSPLAIPLTSPRKSTNFVRRDLFDARFQLISEGAGDVVEEPSQQEEQKIMPSSSSGATRQALAFLDAPSDLVPGVYEGGLKTWECSLDFVDYLDGLKESAEAKSFVGKKTLEIGCGTGVPSMYILREILSALVGTQKVPSKTEIHLQDYNGSVLQLVTLPNLLLTWYTSPHAEKYRSAIDDDEVAPRIDLSVAGELPITPELKASFLDSLESLHISLRFFSGSWDTFDPRETIGTDTYDMVLTSETIYRNDSLQPLIRLMQSACLGTADGTNTASKEYCCLVAAKVLYFGVGGGISDFLKAVESHRATCSTVLERKAGVGRKIMSVRWP